LPCHLNEPYIRRKNVKDRAGTVHLQIIMQLLPASAGCGLLRKMILRDHIERWLQDEILNEFIPGLINYKIKKAGRGRLKYKVR
jgi:hypothetical protein